MKLYEFTLVLDGVNDQTPDLEDKLYEAGCDDALLYTRNHSVYLDFSREAITLKEAVLSAIRQVESPPLGICVISVAPENLVSESEIAKRLEIKKQAVSLWTKGLRRKKIPFPHPVMKLASTSPFWRWHEVVSWLLQNDIINDQVALEDAIFFESINLVLEERRLPNQALKAELMELISS